MIRRLNLAAHEVGGVQSRNRGTRSGNLWNASPAPDGVPVLLAVDAKVEVAARDATQRPRLVPIIVRNWRTTRRPD